MADESGESGTATELTPIEDGFIPLCNGLDLRGWKATDEVKSRWQPSDRAGTARHGPRVLGYDTDLHGQFDGLININRVATNVRRAP